MDTYHIFTSDKSKEDERSEPEVFDTVRVGANISGMRKEAGLTQMELAERLDVSFQAVSNWERGQSMPDISRLSQLAGVFGTTVDEILDSARASQIIASVTDEGAEVAEASMDEIGEIAPLMKAEQVDRLVKGQKKVSMRELGHVAPFLSTALLDDIALAQVGEHKSLHAIGSILPFVSKETLRRIVRQFDAKKNTLHEYAAIFPFLSKEEIRAFAEKALAQGGSLEKLGPLAPFMDKEQLNAHAREALERDGLKALSSIMPFIDEKIVEKYILEHGVE